MANASVKTITQENAAFMERVNALQGRSLNRLGTGNRWASPSDDPAGVGLSEKMLGQQKRIGAAQINVQNAMSLTQSMDGFLQGMSRLLTRMAELAQYSKDPSKNAADAELYRTEFRQLQEQLRGTIGGSVSEIGGLIDINDPLGRFNGNSLFGPDPDGTVILIGKHAQDQLVIPEVNLRTGAMLSIIQQDAAGAFSFDISTQDSVVTLTTALGQISDAEATVGTSRARLELIAGKLVAESQDLESSVSRIRDVDIAKETTRLAKYEMLSKTGSAMLAQQVVAPRDILKLLQD